MNTMLQGTSPYNKVMGQTYPTRVDSGGQNVLDGVPSSNNAKVDGQTKSEFPPSYDKVSLSEQAQTTLRQSNPDHGLTKEEQAEVQILKQRDQEVRAHEQAHAAVGGQYAGSPQYEYETGPDNKKYAVGGEVSIDVSEEKEAEDTIRKMQIVRAAALAPAEPSSQDLKVASEASQKEQQARAELSKEGLSGSEEKDNQKAKAQVQTYRDLAQTDKGSSSGATFINGIYA